MAVDPNTLFSDASDEAAPSVIPEEPELFCVALKVVNAAGHSLFLLPGDTLIAVNGTPFAYPFEQAQQNLERIRPGKTALTFRRDTVEFTVLSDGYNVGGWERVPAHDIPEKRRISPAVLSNWEVYTSEDNLYDLQILAPSLLALIASPLWLAQMRIWVPLTTVLSAVLITIPFGLLLGFAVYVIASIYVWQMSRHLFRNDRIMRGLSPDRVIAAPNENIAHRIFLRQNPDMEFLFPEHAT